VYADVDLVPYISLETLNRVDFSTCISVNPNYIFQAFMVCNNKKNPLFLHFILSFLMNNPYNIGNGPCKDMYDCLTYNIKDKILKPDIIYNICDIRINIHIGPSVSNVKKIDLHWFPSDIIYSLEMINQSISNECFELKIESNILIVKRIDKNASCNTDYSFDIKIKSPQTITLFEEKYGSSWIDAFVIHKGTKILDSRDIEYSQKKW
jgi:hypothetical protein